VEFRPAELGERDAVAALLIAQDWQDGYVDVGETWVACNGDDVVATVRLIAAGDGAWYVADVSVRDGMRGNGIGSGLLRAAMVSRGVAAFYLTCHPERQAFYERLGYESVPKGFWPEPVIAASRAEDDYDSDHDHLHRYMRTP
jgi:predicted N-acetyltransferase YhbS